MWSPDRTHRKTPPGEKDTHEMTKQEAGKLRRLIGERIKWAIEYHLKGGGDPEGWPEIDRKHRKAMKDLGRHIQKLTVEKS